MLSSSHLAYAAGMASLVVIGWVGGMIIAPYMGALLQKFRFWKPKKRTFASDGASMPIVASQTESEINTPRAGGLIIWIIPCVIASILWLGAQIMPHGFIARLNFVTRGQTWLPLFTLCVGGIIGFIDDWTVVKGMGKYIGGGLTARVRISLVIVMAAIGAWWFYEKLEWSSIYIPFFGLWDMGWLFVPFFIIVMLSTFSSGVVDGVDGLSGGVFATIFTSFAALAIVRGQYQLAGLCLVIVGVLLAYLWWNVPPALFYMGETGILALTTTLTVVAFLTQGVFLLPLIGSVLVMEAGSSVIQLLSKKFRGKKVFLAAPIHHHFQALGWPAPQVTMRLWVLSALSGLVGVGIAIWSGIIQ